ncbi:hypothetical protein EES43_28610 [Streptomyces sp. ADI96-02]|uniref:hypothetical protein n=1 Tax=Streptomyces sp. ADI96-02 TaxID=1522760 RepID=UPI000F5548B6|nr:hypothetical protein [Streptomyces sp. ADI96-02]RPK54538.1 hypothetical protein EES43_28610 [Streptomyces sp. ADI96-02]
MSPVTEQWGEVLRTHLALGEDRPAVRAAATFSSEAGFFAAVGREGEDAWRYFRDVAPALQEEADGGNRGRDDVEALSTVCEETLHPRGLRLAGVDWRRESLERVTDAVTGTELDLALLRDGSRSMWVVRTRQGVCTFVLVDGETEGHATEARSLALDFDSFLAGQGY